MLTLRRRRSASESELPARLPEFRGSDEQLADEIERLTEANRKRETSERDLRLLQLRNQAGVRLVQAAAAPPPHPEPDVAALPAGEGLPEFGLGEVTPGLL